ncbi:MAG: hypothetical protein SGILL_009105, partial [Bacillariaceae sp.]
LGIAVTTDAFPLSPGAVATSSSQSLRQQASSLAKRHQQRSSGFGRLVTHSTIKNDSSTTDKPPSPPTPSQKPAPFQPPARPATQYDAIVAGGGPAGLMTAIMLSQKYGPSYRIASAMEKFGVLPDFIDASVEVEGRRDWQPGMTKVEDGRTTIAKKDPPSRVLPRDKLVGVFHEHLVENYIEGNGAKIDLLYGYEIVPMSFGNEQEGAPVKVRITKCEDVSDADAASQDSEQMCNVDEYVEATTDFLVGADGASRTIARVMETADAERYNNLNVFKKAFAKRPFRITRFEDDNPRVYKSVPIVLPTDWPKGLNYSARSRNSSRITLEALPSDDKGSLCALLLMRPDDELAQPDVDPKKLRAFFDEEFPQFGALVDDEEMARVAQKPCSRLPAFRYAGPRLNMGYRTMILGDAAHTVKPYYGLGANTALEDVEVLSDILDQNSAPDVSYAKDAVPPAVQSFSDQRSGDAEALVTISRNMDRPGKLFILNFLLPIILDGIFHKIAPKIVRPHSNRYALFIVWSFSNLDVCSSPHLQFGPNMFGMFQIKDIGFKQIQRKKRLDRTLQVAILGTIAGSFVVLAKRFVSLLARATGRSHSLISATIAAAMFTLVAAKQLLATKAAAKESR